jgi:hypothetical protein
MALEFFDDFRSGRSALDQALATKREGGAETRTMTIFLQK